MTRVGVVVFDLDGTLVESREDIAGAVNHALVVSGRDALSIDAIGALIGDGARSLLARAAGVEETAPEVDTLLVHYTEHYLAHPADRTAWIEGAVETVETIRGEFGIPVALCTNKTRSITDALLAALQPKIAWSFVVGGGDGFEKKPSPASLLGIADALRVDPARVVMVGDGPQDVLAAKRAGARSIGVVTREPMTSRLVASGPEELVDSMRRVPDVVRRWQGARREAR